MTLPRPQDLHTVDQAAAALGVPAQLIRRWRRDGKVMPAGMLKASVPGGLQPVFTLEELRPMAERYLESQARRHTDT